MPRYLAILSQILAVAPVVALVLTVLALPTSARPRRHGDIAGT